MPLPTRLGVYTHTQVRDPCESAAACWRPALGTPSPWPACVLRAPPDSHRPVLRRTPGRTPFHPFAVLPRPASRTHPLPATPFSVSTITDGNAQAWAAAHFPPLRWPDCTLSRLRAEEYDRPVTQSIATPEPSSRTIPTLVWTLVAR